MNNRPKSGANEEAKCGSQIIIFLANGSLDISYLSMVEMYKMHITQ